MNKTYPSFRAVRRFWDVRVESFFSPKICANYLMPLGSNAFLPIPLFRKMTPQRSLRNAFPTFPSPDSRLFSHTAGQCPKTGRNRPLALSLNFVPNAISRILWIFFVFLPHRRIYIFSDPVWDGSFPVFWKPPRHDFRPISASIFNVTFAYWDRFRWNSL